METTKSLGGWGSGLGWSEVYGFRGLGHGGGSKRGTGKGNGNFFWDVGAFPLVEIPVNVRVAKGPLRVHIGLV